MTSCELFRSRFHAGTEDAVQLAHLRSCDRCLDFAANADPDVMFRALGGDDLVPPGGVDAFVDDVMRQVRVRTAETTVSTARVVAWPRRLAIAATLVAGVTGAMLFNRADAPTNPGLTPLTATVAAGRELRPHPALASKPVVESYESENATIVEVPTESASDDVKIVMIFDENLPADL
jgi:hypothetical protein